MSINAHETGPIVFLDATEAMPGPCFALVHRWQAEVCAARPQRLLLSLDLDHLETDGCAALFDRVQPSGILLTGCRGRADLQAADVALGVIEAETGRAAGSLSIVAVFGAASASFLGADRLAGGSPRLIAIVLDEDALAAAIGLSPETARSLSPAILLARGTMTLQAADVGVPCFWSLPSGETDGYALKRLRDAAVQQGFRDVVVGTPAHWVAFGQAERRN
ncbi:hypothetical protein ASG39_15460 [Rhizobium sp. Leaf371]|uniref:hypothetical protein n=1 Tax=Rhizobium sp. Leaf371 TaxID=1736355 RepID=UPI000712AC19|nr:hypothetical protein [Rhizobium sp. Leaf371]KQS63292.1 hypothetical protein ASG39_15460 [Rhizobium sp. Leaf371]